MKSSACYIAPIETAIYSIKWAHDLASVSSPTDDSFVKLTLEGCRCHLAKQKLPKEPVSSDVLTKLASDNWGGEQASILDIRLLCLCLISFAGMLRNEEVISLRIRDVSFHPDHMILFIPKRKND